MIIAETTTTRRLPGEAGIWVLIGGDLMIFGLFFATLLYYRGLSLPIYVSSQHARFQGSRDSCTLICMGRSMPGLRAGSSQRCLMRSPILFRGMICRGTDSCCKK